MDKTKVIKRGSSSLLILFVVFVFVLCSLFLILYGAYVYTNIRDRVESDFNKRMSISYVTNKLRACDVKDGVTVGDGNSSLRLTNEPWEEFPLYMHIYYYNGNIMEYVTQGAEPFDPNDGEIIMQAGSFTITQFPGGLNLIIGIGPEDIAYTVSLKCA